MRWFDTTERFRNRTYGGRKVKTGSYGLTIQMTEGAAI